MILSGYPDNWITWDLYGQVISSIVESVFEHGYT